MESVSASAAIMYLSILFDELKLLFEKGGI